MTTAIIHGDPGSFKTATLVSQYGIPALYKGRTVVTNIRGFDDLKKIELVYKKKLPDNANLIFIPFNREGFRKMGNFFHWAPAGALILFDEIQRVYPTRLRNLNMFDCEPSRNTGYVDKHTGQSEDIQTVEEAFDCHRHMNWDIYMSTPNIEKVHKELRQVAEFGYRQKGYATVSPLISKLLGDFKRVKHNAENKGNTDSQAMLSTSHRIDKRAFECYESTATGQAKTTHTKTNIFAQPKLLLVICILAYVIYHFTNNFINYGTPFPLGDDFDKASHEQQINTETVSAIADSSKLDFSKNTKTNTNIPDNSLYIGNNNKQPIDNLVKNITGWTATFSRTGFNSVYVFESKIKSRYITIDSSELKKLGFEIQPFRNFIIIKNDEYSHFVYPADHSKVNDQLAFNKIENKKND